MHQNLLKRPASLAAIAALLLPFAALAVSAETDADQILARMDQRLTSARDQSFRYEMITEKPGEAERRCTMAVHIKGKHWRRLEFFSPGDVKGMKILILSQSKMYLYLPAYRKVRRVATHVRDQGFMGSAYSHDDMSATTYSDKLTGKLLEENDTHWVIEGTRREGNEYRYAKVKLTIRKDNHQPERLEYYSDTGQLVKSEVRSDFECRDEHCNPKVMTLTDHTRGNVRSTMRRLDWKVNPGLEDRFFTVRALQRRR